jgi:hypothetical protein
MFIKKAEVPDALQSLRPGARWAVRGDEYSGIEWMDTEQTCPTEEEVRTEVARLAIVYQLEACKREAKKRIAATDWAVLPDVGLANKSDFESYRAQVRTLIITPTTDPVWPVEPDAVWA